MTIRILKLKSYNVKKVSAQSMTVVFSVYSNIVLVLCFQYLIFFSLFSAYTVIWWTFRLMTIFLLKQTFGWKEPFRYLKNFRQVHKIFLKALEKKFKLKNSWRIKIKNRRILKFNFFKVAKVRVWEFYARKKAERLIHERTTWK